jgi:ribosomal protein L37AE/L43A
MMKFKEQAKNQIYFFEFMEKRKCGKPNFSLVYKCPFCHLTAKKREIGGYTHHFCPKCGRTEKSGLIPIYIVEKAPKKVGKH